MAGKRNRRHQRSLEAPMNDHEREAKFADCLRWGNQGNAGALYPRLRDLTDFEDLTDDNAFWNLIADAHPEKQ
ncbi:hypothetical protein NXC12_PE00879 (plasmid) [Rhizobium etli]|uniref:Uncharacterized protein n=2 Tax=Rhizobium etli TaxID=29449 RepID=A0AAN1ENY8_RHIET|nr:hypothetical protein NXC12_PE00879 [Rhizobium etli]